MGSFWVGDIDTRKEGGKNTRNAAALTRMILARALISTERNVAQTNEN